MILQTLAKSKQDSTTNLAAALNLLHRIPENTPACFSIFVDRKRKHRPFRLGFLAHEWDIDGTTVRVEGEEPHNGSSLIKLDEVDCTVVGLDELLSMTQYYLRDPTHVTKWGMYNYHLEKPTSIRVAGSAQLTRYNPVLGCQIQDMVGFFLISKPGGGRQRSRIDFPTLARFGRKVFVKGRYSGIVMAAYPGLKVMPVENVEDAVLESEKGSVGIEIVQTGNTLKAKGLHLHGSPLFLSESLYVVDYDRYQANPALRKLIESLNPIGYFEDGRIRHFALWYAALEKNLGDAWKEPPPIDELFCGPDDLERGLRPYRLKTRNWKPDDHYLHEEAITLVEQARHLLLNYYRQAIDNTSLEETTPNVVETA